MSITPIVMPGRVPPLLKPLSSSFGFGFGFGFRSSEKKKEKNVPSGYAIQDDCRRMMLPTDFLKIQYTITIRRRKSMKKFTVTNEKIGV